MFSLPRRPRLSLGVGIAAYLVGSAFAAAIATHAVWHAGAALLEQLVPADDRASSNGVIVRAPAMRGPMSIPVSSPPSVRSEAAMTQLQERWDGRWGGPNGRPQPRAWGSPAPQFGASARNPFGLGSRPYDPDDDEGDRRAYGTYRTVCVRLCDGYYFPVSFAVPAEHLERDRALCENRCGAQGRLFVHRNPGGAIEEAQDLSGRPYRQLKTAFLYRTEYVASCTCQPQPWDQASLDRHRLYALAAAANKGSKDAAKEMKALQAKLREDARVAAAKPGPPSTISAPVPVAATRAQDPDAAARAAEIAAREDGNIMGLGGDDSPKAKADSKPERTPLKSNPNRDWARRAFDPSASR
jgi:hypothetical protein